VLCFILFVSFYAQNDDLDLSEEDIVAVRWAAIKWRNYRQTSLEEALLSTAALLKEANAICVELNKAVSVFM